MKSLSEDFVEISKKHASDVAHTDFTRAAVSQTASAPFKTTVSHMVSYADDVVTKDFVNDIGILYKIIVSTDSLGRATIKVTKPILDRWGITEDELFAKAKENIDKEAIIKDMQEMMFEIMGGRESNDLAREIQPGLMSVMTNTTKVDGAAVMLCLPDLVENGELEDKDYYVIPSSIHECILVDTDSMEPDALNAMIREVNATQVAPEDFLSDYGLKYDAKLGKIVVA